MSAFMKIGDIKGEATDQDHQDWIAILQISNTISRTIPQGSKDQQRAKGETVLAPVSIRRDVDKSSPKLAEACASGKFFPEAEFHLCSTVNGKEEPYLKFKLKDVIVSNYGFAGNSTGDPIPSEDVLLDYTEIEWTYVVLDPKSGSKKGNVVGKYNPMTGKAG
jgi:type VI secretion system secreted protein Hcp